MPEASVLNSVKKILGLGADYTPFDSDILMHINSAFARLNQLGIGPDTGYMIEDASDTWLEFLGGDPRLNSVKTFVYLYVRLFFDPPATSFTLAAMQEQIKQLEWTLNAVREHTQWVDPLPRVMDPDSLDDFAVIDGGNP